MGYIQFYARPDTFIFLFQIPLLHPPAIQSKPHLTYLSRSTYKQNQNGRRCILRMSNPPPLYPSHILTSNISIYLYTWNIRYLTKPDHRLLPLNRSLPHGHRQRHRLRDHGHRRRRDVPLQGDHNLSHLWLLRPEWRTKGEDYEEVEDITYPILIHG